MSDVDEPLPPVPPPLGSGGKPPRHWADLSPEDRVRAVTELGMAGYRADQVSRHYFGRLSAEPESWTDLSTADGTAVATTWLPRLLSQVRTVRSDGADTCKYLYLLAGGASLETVVMAYHDRVTACVSSQAGCGIGCPFCATGESGLERNLSAGEIVEQVRLAAVAARMWSPTRSARLSNVVFMGMGEPLANYRAVLTAVRRIVTPIPNGFGISARSVTVSTAGLAPRIRELAGEGLPVTLAVSLHAPDDELRDRLVPLNRRWPVADVIAAADEYAERTGRRYSLEYALIRDVNDQPWRAKALAELVRGRLAHLNLIPLNPTPGGQWDASTPDAQARFVAELRADRVAVTVRDTRGREIDGACGQLAAAAG